MMAGELRWLRALQPNYIAVVWHPSQVMLRKIPTSFSHIKRTEIPPGSPAHRHKLMFA